MEGRRPNFVPEPDLTVKDLNLRWLEADFPREQFARSPWPEGTVVLYQSNKLLNNYEWRYVDEYNVHIGGANLFLPELKTSW